MNLSPEWVIWIKSLGYEAVHWSSICDPRAEDSTIMEYASEQNYIVLTHDLDFGTLLAVTQASGPSVIQVRTQCPLPSHIGALLARALRQFETELTSGALIVVDESRQRARLLPLQTRHKR